jgi:hypothetical protein
MPGLVEPTQPGKREDLSDLISNVDMRGTPLTTMLKKGPRPKNTLFDWQVDAYDAPNTNGVVDGEDVNSYDNKAKNRQKLSGRVQKVRRPWKVSDMAEEVSDPAGVKSEAANAIAKSLVELKRDMECVIGGDNDSQADNGSVPYLTRALGKWIQNGAQSDLPVPSAFRTPTTSIDTTAMASLTEATIQGVLQSVYLQTGENKRYALICGVDFKRAVTDMTKTQAGVSSTVASIRTYNQPDAKEGMIYSNVDMFVGDFGELEIMPSVWLAFGTSNSPTRRAYLLDTSKLTLRPLRNPGSKRLADQGGGPRGYVDAIFALQCDNPLGHGKFAATS